MNGFSPEKSNECIARSRALLLESRSILEEAEQVCAILRCLSFFGGQERRIAFDSELHQIQTDHIRMKREAAARARRLADGFWSSEDRDRAVKYAEELEARAEELGRALTARP